MKGTPRLGECPHCHEVVGLRRDGTVRLHPKDKGSGATGGDCRANCYGSYAYAVGMTRPGPGEATEG